MSLATDAVAAVQKAIYGKTPDGKTVDVYTLSGSSITVKIITYGARVIAVDVPDRIGKTENVALGLPNLAAYEEDTAYFGAIVGRYANRIAKGKFMVDGKSYQSPINNGANSLHGGTTSFAQRVWTAHELPNGVELSLVSPDGEMGYPGALTVHCRYTLEGGSTFKVDLTATTDKDTVLNLTNHSYFNISGEGNGNILHDQVQIDADEYVPVDDTQIPTGELAPVAGTPFDFRTLHVVGDRIDAGGNHQLQLGGGYDHSFLVRGKVGTLRDAAKVIDPETGRTLTVSTTQPGVHLYTGNSLTGTLRGTNGKLLERRGGLALETQHFADAPNHPTFQTTLLKPGQTFHETTVFAFGIEK